MLGLDFRAYLAGLWLLMSGHDKLHSTSLASAVLLGTVLTEVAPLVIATSHLILIVETHVCC